MTPGRATVAARRAAPGAPHDRCHNTIQMSTPGPQGEERAVSRTATARHTRDVYGQAGPHSLRSRANRTSAARATGETRYRMGPSFRVCVTVPGPG